MATGQSSSMKSHRSSRLSTAPLDLLQVQEASLRTERLTGCIPAVHGSDPQSPGTIGITDDVIVHGKDDKDHDRNLHHLMKVAQKCGLVFNAAKCFIKTPQIKFFGMVYDANGVHPDPEKCAEIQAIPAPKNVTEIQQFLGIIQFMAPFISKLADQTAPLRALTKKDVPFEWNSSLQKVFENVKASICKDIALTYFDVTKPTTIQVDASKIGIGAALLQDGRPIAFASLCPDRDRAAVCQHRT